MENKSKLLISAAIAGLCSASVIIASGPALAAGHGGNDCNGCKGKTGKNVSKTAYLQVDSKTPTNDCNGCKGTGGGTAKASFLK